MVLRILLVEDNPGDVDLIRMLLPKTGPVCFRVESVQRLSEALARLQDVAVDLILLDLGLPDSVGLDTFRRLKVAKIELPVVILTGNTDQEAAVTAVKEGAQDFLIKGQITGALIVRSILYALERKRAADKVLASEGKYRELYESMMDAYVQVDLTGRIITFNKAYVDLLGYTEEELLQLTYKDITPDTWKTLEVDIIEKQVLARGYSDVYEKEYRRKDGTLVSIELRTNLLNDEAGRPSGMWAIIRNITDRKQAEEKIRRQRDITAAINRILQYSFTTTMDAALVNISLAEAKQLTGSTFGWIGEINRSGDIVAAAVDTPDWDFSRVLATPPMTSWDNGIRDFFDSLMQDGQSLIINSPGAHPHLAGLLHAYPQLTSFLGVPLRQDSRIVGMIVLVNKLSGFAPHDLEAIEALSLVLSETLQRKRNEAELELLRTAIEQAGETIVITNATGAIQYVNPAFTRITGYGKAEALGCTPRILKSGHQDSTFYATLWDTITRGDTFQARIVNKRKDGSFFTEDTTISPVCDTAGTIVNYVAVKRDITDQLRLEVKYQQAQKLEAIGTLAGGIAHDFNNILTAIMGYTELATLEVGEQSKAGKDLQQVYSASKRAVDLVRQILTISRQVEKQKHPIRIQYIIKEVLKLLRPSVTTLIDIQSSIDQECPTIFADPTEIYQVIMNLCTNAYHAMRDVQRETHVMAIQLVPVVIDEKTALQLGLNISPGRFVKLTVSDTGCGMNAHVMSKIFDPYFTTKKEGEGTGLGLAMVNSIVTRSSGAITVESTIGEGSTFCIFLPIQEEPTPELQLPKTQNTEQLKGCERIMVIDDEEPIVRLLQRILTEFGYKVATFIHFADAMAAFNKDPLAFDLVITDMNMPKVVGTELARAFLEIRPDLPIILCTGYSENVDTETARAIGIKKFLFKPVDRDILVWLVRNLLDGKVE